MPGDDDSAPQARRSAWSMRPRSGADEDATEAIDITRAPNFSELTPPEQSELTQFVELVKQGELKLFIPEVHRCVTPNAAGMGDVLKQLK